MIAKIRSLFQNPAFVQGFALLMVGALLMTVSDVSFAQGLTRANVLAWFGAPSVKTTITTGIFAFGGWIFFTQRLPQMIEGQNLLLNFLFIAGVIIFGLQWYEGLRILSSAFG